MTSSAYPEASQATSALVWSIVALVCCQPAAIVGYIQSRNELEAIASGRRDPANQGTANAAKIISIIAGVLLLVGLAAIVLIVTLGGLGAFLADVDNF